MKARLPNLPQRASALEHLLRARSNAIVLGEIAPDDRSGAVEKKLGRPCYSLTAHSGALVQQIVLANDESITIREERERVARLPRELARDLGCVDTDRDGADAQALELREILLKTP